MALTPTFPGVYIEEISSGVRAITGVATSITAFVGYTARGLDHRASLLFSYADFERAFGGLASDSELSYAVKQFYDNGGSQAVVVRVPKADSIAAVIVMKDGGGKASLQFTALSRGAWANRVVLEVDYDGIAPAETRAFNLTLTDLGTGATEFFTAVTVDSASARFIETVLNDPDTGSKMASVRYLGASALRPVQSGTTGAAVDMTKLKNDLNYSILLSSDVPAGPLPYTIANLKIPVVEKGETLPTTVSALCRFLERKINGALSAAAKTGAAVRCAPTLAGTAIRVYADFDQGQAPGTLDAVLTFAAGTPVDASNGDADTALKLAAGAPNVGRYLLGAGRSARAQAFPLLGSPPVATSVPGVDGVALPTTANLIGSAAAFTGIYALEKVDLFNILCIPDATRALPGNPSAPDPAVDSNAVFGEAMAYCRKRRAFLLLDAPPNVVSVEAAIEWKSAGLTVHDTNGAAYFPRLRAADPLNDFQPRSFAPCGVIAGLYARTDTERGVWKAPAGTDAHLHGVQSLLYKLTDGENGALNPLGLNSLRTFPVYGTVAWGARTLTGADAEASEWKYVPVRRLALFLEESLFRGTQWVVFEPNDEPLWAQIRLNLGAFMHTLFRQGAFQGATPREAYFVKCDKETTTQNDINAGVVNIVVGFAPLKPAEFVIIQLQQIAGTIQA
jgi:uncharacterized protein